MTSNGNNSEFVSSHEVKLTLSLTPEQAMAMQAWSDAIPTMYMLDICVVNATKLSEGALAADARKAALASRLRHLDRPQNSFSYLLALTEKVSDLQVSLSDDELETQNSARRCGDAPVFRPGKNPGGRRLLAELCADAGAPPA